MSVPLYVLWLLGWFVVGQLIGIWLINKFDRGR